MKNFKKNGFSLIEIVVTIFLLITIIFVYQAAVNNLAVNKLVKEEEIALRIASTEMETLRSTPFGSLPTSGSFSDPLLSLLQNGQGNLTITDFNNKTKEVDVLVSWTGQGNISKTVTLKTLINQTGI